MRNRLGLKQLNNIMEHISDGVVALDGDWRYTYVNARAARMLQKESAQDLIGKHIWTEYPEGVGQPFHQAYLKAYQTQQVIVFEEYYPPWDQWFENRIYPSEDGLTIYFTDITERQKSENALQDSEAHLRTLIEALPDLVWLKDVDGVYLNCNLKFEQLFGAKEAEIIGKTDYDFVEKELADSFREHDKAAMRSGKPTLNEEDVIYASDNHRELLETIKTPMFALDGTLMGVLGVSRDITERRKTEEILRRSQKMDAVGQLTGGIAHDFNNLLGIILGNLELLEPYVNGDDKAVKRVKTIEGAGLRAAQLTRQLLSYSRKEASLESVIKINQVISEMAELISRSLTPQIEINYKISKDLWFTKVDPGDLKDALLNLCINARDSMAGHGHITIETHNVNLDETNFIPKAGISPGQYIEVIISDTGEGIPSEHIDRIFEPFFTTKDRGKGTGLGLAMVYAFVKRSAGYIKCNSEVGVGTTFRIYLPRDKSDKTDNEQGDKQYEAIPFSKETILVVDDERALMELAKDMLESLGYRVLTACNGKRALEQLTHTPEVELLFSDVVMPNGMNGYELAEQATAIQHDLRVLLTSGIDGNIEPRKNQARFNTNLLSKPYRKADLAKQVRSLLDDLKQRVAPTVQ